MSREVTHLAFLPMLILLLIVVVPLLIMLIRLCIKKPKYTIIFAIVPVIILLLMFFIAIRVRVEKARKISKTWELQNIVTAPVDAASPIWSEGIEDQFEADVYPSKTAAIRSIALKIGKQFRNIMVGTEIPETIVIIQNSQELELVEQLRDAIIKRYPDIKCRIVGSSSGFNVNEAYINFYSMQNDTTRVSQGFRNTLQNGKFQATFSNQNRSTIISVDYVEQPWVADFASFTNSQPGKHYIVAKSAETSMTPDEANLQAIHDACIQVGALLVNIQNPAKLNYDNLLKSGVVADKFVQSFDGTAGKIWRQAILLDVSPDKLNLLAEIISGVNRTKSKVLIRTILSVLGLFVLITIVYAFLNAATKGYYSLSLKIIGIILAVIFLFIILFLFRGGPSMGGL
jgi:hypothetical protein